MSVRVITSVLEHSQSEYGARLVLMCLADASHDDGISWDGTELIAKKSRLSVRQATRCLADLEELGEIEKRKVQVGRRRINIYRVALPGIAEPRYDKLPFELVDPFSSPTVAVAATDGQYVQPSDDDDWTSATTTTGHMVQSPEAVLSFKPRSKDPRKITPPISPPDRPTEVDRRKVTDVEYDLARSVLAAFNDAAGTRHRSKGNVAKVVMRIREYPELSLHDHEVIIRRQLADPWWKGPTSPAVIYGNDALFERAVHAVESAPTSRGITADDAEAFGTTWGPGTPYATPWEAEAATHAAVDAEVVDEHDAPELD